MSEALNEELSEIDARRKHKSILALLKTPPITATECQTMVDWELDDVPFNIVQQLHRELHTRMNNIAWEENNA